MLRFLKWGKCDSDIKIRKIKDSGFICLRLSCKALNISYIWTFSDNWKKWTITWIVIKKSDLWLKRQTRGYCRGNLPSPTQQVRAPINFSGPAAPPLTRRMAAVSGTETPKVGRNTNIYRCFSITDAKVMELVWPRKVTGTNGKLDPFASAYARHPNINRARITRRIHVHAEAYYRRFWGF